MIQPSNSLIATIQDILDGKRTDSSSIEVVAKDYLKIANQTNSRIKQFCKLIREGCYYAALDIASLIPDLVDQMDAIRFPREKEWLQYLEKAKLKTFDGFNDHEIKKVREICKDRSLYQPAEYRDFRKAILKKDKSAAVKSLRMLVERFPHDLNARQELLRLEYDVFEALSDKLKSLLRKNLHKDISPIVEEVLSQNWLIELSSEAWKEALQIFQKDQIEQALEKINGIIRQIKVIQRVGNWTDAQPLVKELIEIKESPLIRSLDRDIYKELLNAINWFQNCEAEHAKKQKLEERLKHFENKLIIDNLQNNVAILSKRETKSYKISLEYEWKELKELFEALSDELTLKYNEAQAYLSKAINEKNSHVVKSKMAWLMLFPIAGFVGFLLYFIHHHESKIADDLQSVYQAEDFSETNRILENWDAFTAKFLSHHNPFRNYDAHKRVKEVQSWVKEVNARHQKITQLLDTVEESLVKNPSPSELRRIQFNLSIIEDLFVKLPQIESSDNRDRFQKMTQQVFETHASHIQNLRQNLQESLNELVAIVDRFFPDEKTDFLNAHDELSKTKELLNSFRLKLRQSFEEDQIEDIKNEFTGLVEQIDMFERNLLSLEKNLSKISASISLAEYLNYLKNMGDLPFKHHPVVRQVNEAKKHISKFENLAQQLLLPGNQIAWQQYTKADHFSFKPDSYDAKEHAVYTTLTNNEVLGSIFVYRIYHYVDGTRSDTTRSIYAYGELDVKKNSAQTSGRLIQTIKQFDEAKIGTGVPFKEQVYICEMNANGDPLSGDLLELDRLSPESGYFKIADELCEYNSEKKLIGIPILQILDEVKKNTFIHPIFKAYITQELFNIMVVRAFDWGLNFSPTAQIEYQKLSRIKGKLYPYDWLRKSTRNRLTPALTQYYSEVTEQSYYDQALASRELFAQIARQRVRFGGVVNKEGRFHILSSTPNDRKLFGLLENGKMGILRTPSNEKSPSRTFKGVPYTPILFFNDPPSVILDRVERKTGVPVSSEEFKPFLPEIFL